MDGRGEHREAIAVIGIACHFPGARDAAEFHELTVSGRRMFRPIPGPSGRMPHGALLDGWGAGSVGKLAAETIALALADAGLQSTELRDTGTRAGLILASSVPEVGETVCEGFGVSAGAGFAATSLPAAANVSSLNAVIAACDALSTRDLDVAIAGGAELGIDLDWLAQQATAGNLGTREMRVYDVDPLGLLPGDGCGVVVLTRAADARAAGMPVYAEIAGWAAVPGSPDDAHTAMLGAYHQAQVGPADIHLIEGHGAGTAAGDEAELAALARLRQGGAAIAALGAVSASIGHARAAAGVASLIKIVTAMVAGTMPPGTRCPRPHPLIESGDALLRLPPDPEPWPDGTRLAAVNSFAATDPASDGVHLVLRREPDRRAGQGRRRRHAQAAAQDANPANPAPPDQFSEPGPGRHSAATTTAEIPIAPQVKADSAATTTRQREPAGPAAIFALCGTEAAAVAATLDVIAASAAELAGTDLRDLAQHMAATAQWAAERGAPLRVTVTAATSRQLAARAQRAAELLRGGPLVRGGRGAALTLEPGISISASVNGNVVLMFPGLATGSPAAHTALLAGSLDRMRAVDRLGVKPAAAVGYGFGELAGLVWAGCLPAAEAARLVALRGRVLRGCTAGLTAMVRVSADIALAGRLAALNGLHIAAYETPDSQLLAGPAMRIRDLASRAPQAGVTAEILPAAAVHSPAMASCTAPWRSVLAGTPFETPRRRLISTVTGQLVTATEDIAGLLARQLTQPVLFAPAITLAAAEADLLVIAGPDPDLRLTSMATAASGVPAIPMPALVRESAADQADVIAVLFAVGAITDLMPFLSAPAANPAADQTPADQTAADQPRTDPASVSDTALSPVTWAVPAARDGEPARDEHAGGQHADGQNGAGCGTTVRSAIEGLAG
jgi:enediyne polyketide synthase